MDDMNDAAQLKMYETCLYHTRTDRAIRLMVSKCLETYRITIMEWLLLGTVGSGPPNGLNMSALARSLEVTMPQVTVLNSHLLEQKLVKQKADKYDRRNRYVLITGKGKSLLENIEENVHMAMKSWLENIPPEQLRSYNQTVKQISHTPQPVPVEDATPLPTGMRREITVAH